MSDDDAIKWTAIAMIVAIVCGTVVQVAVSWKSSPCKCGEKCPCVEAVR